MNPIILFPSQFPSLRTDRLDLTIPKLADAPELFQLRSDPEFMNYVGKHPMKELEEAKEFILRIHDQFKTKQGISWKISEKDNDQFIGYLGFWQIDFEHCRAEIGYGLSKDYQSKGFMKEAINMIVQYAFKELNIHSIKADIDPQNHSSQKLLLACKFKKEAHIRENFFFDGKFTDSEYYGIIASDI